MTKIQNVRQPCNGSMHAWSMQYTLDGICNTEKVTVSATIIPNESIVTKIIGAVLSSLKEEDSQETTQRILGRLCHRH